MDSEVVDLASVIAPGLTWATVMSVATAGRESHGTFSEPARLALDAREA
jgi:hypothetical protein